jgi:flagellar hook assembly protein FlgD
VGVYNEAGELVKTLYAGPSQASGNTASFASLSLSEGEAPLKITFAGILDNGSTQVSWDGTNNQGQALSGGVYYLHVTTTDSFGAVTSLNQSVNVMAAPPAASITVYNSAGEVVARLTPPPGAGSLSAAQLQNTTMVAGQKPLSLGLRGGLGTSTLTWNGLNAQGNPVAPGSYTILIHDQGYTSQLSFTVIEAPGAGITAAVAAPNPAQAADNVLVIAWSGSGTGPKRVCLYNAASELVATAQASLSEQKVEIGISRLAGGIYIATVQDQASHQVIATKVCMIR